MRLTIVSRSAPSCAVLAYRLSAIWPADRAAPGGRLAGWRACFLGLGNNHSSQMRPRPPVHHRRSLYARDVTESPSAEFCPPAERFQAWIHQQLPDAERKLDPTVCTYRVCVSHPWSRAVAATAWTLATRLDRVAPGQLSSDVRGDLRIPGLRGAPR